MSTAVPLNADQAWRRQLRTILEDGMERSPRGKKTKDIQNGALVVDMMRPVVTTPERKLSYQFMAAEAFWILSGSDRVEDIAPWNKNISQFSDDSMRFFGAYGPKILNQLGYVIKKLEEDPDTRQAGLTIWRENPPATKDVPCTVAMFFGICDQDLDAYVFMRSSDAWLGLPYDMFNFSMVSHLICDALNVGRRQKAAEDGEEAQLVNPGRLYLTMASSHLYEASWDEAQKICSDFLNQRPVQWATPYRIWDGQGELMETLMLLRDSKPGDPLRWWEYAARP